MVNTAINMITFHRKTHVGWENVINKGKCSLYTYRIDVGYLDAELGVDAGCIC